MKQRLKAMIRIWKVLRRPALSSLLIAAIVLTGIPLFPGWGTERVLAATTAGINPSHIVPVYGGQSEIYWNYGQKTHSTTIERCEVTPIPPEEQGEPYEDEEGNMILPPTHTKVSLGTIGSQGAGSPGETERYEWDGSVGGNPLSDGTYTICAVPSGAPEYFGFANASVENPSPPAPAYIQVVPSLDAGGRSVHTIRGIAENGTQVNISIQYTKRDGPNQVPNPEANQELMVHVPFGKLPDGSHLTWSKDAEWQTEELNLNGYFTNFPMRDDNKPEQYIREWELEVELEPYQIANITATAVRTSSNPYYNETNPVRNKSAVSKVTEATQILRYIAPDWDINWEALAGYYYRAESVEEMIAGAERIAEDNGISIDVCEDGEHCPGFITKGWNLIIQEPQLAGQITQKELEDLTHEKIANRLKHPSPLWWDPINLATGDFIFSHSNMSLSAIMPLDFTLTYHSRDKYNGAVGVGWHHSFDWRLVPYGEDALKVISPEGAQYVFEEMSDGHYRTPAGTYETLTRNADGTFQMATPQRTAYTFREDGNLLRITDANGNRINLTYEGAVLKKVDTLGASMSFGYGTAGKISSVTDQTGRTVSYEYDPLTHDLLAMKLPDGGAIRYEYDDKHQITKIIDPNNTATLENRYDDEGRVVYQKDFSGAAGTIAYDPEARKTVTTDPLNRVKTFEFDERFRQTAIHYPDGTTERFEYDANDNMILYTDRNGEDWTYTYDTLGNLLQQTDPLGHTSTVRYNAWNKPFEVIDALGNVTSLGYDGKGNLVSITDAIGNESKIEMDARGVPTATINAAGERTELTNDHDGFVRLVTDPEGYTMEMIRDGLHRVIAQIDPLQARTNVVYDPRDRIKEQINALGHTEQFSYDKNSNLTSVIDRTNKAYTYKYDVFDRVAAMTDAGGNITRFEYDAVGNRTKTIEPNGAATQYFYNDTNRLIRTVDAEGNETVYEYDGNGNVTAVVDPRSGRTEVAYDARNLPIQVTDAEGGVSTYEYDALGRLVAETDHYGAATIYNYDAIGRLAKVVDALGQETAYAYDQAGRLIEVSKPNGAKSI
ncbi:MAG: hypothetical protein K0Q63_2289, partial [Paenibacillus sp.]|nr:hypothetical protein [Paenibacillus sp.]